MKVTAVPTVCSLSSAPVMLTAPPGKQNHITLVTDTHPAIDKNTDGSSETFWRNISEHITSHL
jgi:hypothetical protein